MRKRKIPALLLVTIAFFAFTLGFFLGRMQDTQAVNISVPQELLTTPTQEAPAAEAIEETAVISFPISINQAGKEELMALPGIGDILAERILAYRRENGDFRSPEELLNVEGIGKKRLEEILDFITIGG